MAGCPSRSRGSCRRWIVAAAGAARPGSAVRGLARWYGGAGRKAPSPSCRKRPFATHTDQLEEVQRRIRRQRLAAAILTAPRTAQPLSRIFCIERGKPRARWRSRGRAWRWLLGNWYRACSNAYSETISVPYRVHSLAVNWYLASVSTPRSTAHTQLMKGLDGYVTPAN